MLNLNSVLVFSTKPKELAKFYQKVLKVKPDWSGGDFVGFKVGNGYLTIGPHSKVKGKTKEPYRIMLNFETRQVQSHFKRLKKMKVKVIKAPYHPDEEEGMLIATLADPDGNIFQLMSPWK